jgi:hypothetical protein
VSWIASLFSPLDDYFEVVGHYFPHPLLRQQLRMFLPEIGNSLSIIAIAAICIY